MTEVYPQFHEHYAFWQEACEAKGAIRFESSSGRAISAVYAVDAEHELIGVWHLNTKRGEVFDDEAA